MENYIQNIELINSYLNNFLSEKEIENFKNKLRRDALFKNEYDTHIVFLEGLKRQSLKREILKAKKYYTRVRWFKIIGISILILLGSILIYLNLNRTKSIKSDILPEGVNTSKTVLDSVSNKKVKETGTIFKDTLLVEKAVIKEVTVVKKVVKTKNKIVEVIIPKKTPQTFVINAIKDTTVVCKEGTKLIIKANSFVDFNNKMITNDVRLNITEYYKLSDMVLANLTTQANGEQLETGGMLNIQAYCGEELLKLKLNANIEILFPTKHKKTGMQLFTGEWKKENINWVLEEQKEISDEEVILEESVEVPFAVVEEVPVFPGCENLKNASTKSCTTDAINKFISTNFNTEIATSLGLTRRQRINSIFKINEEGDVVSIKSRASHPDLEREANRVIASLPKMQPGKQRGKKVTVPYSVPITFQTQGIIIASIGGVIQDTVAIQESNVIFEERLASKDSANVSVTEVNRYILRSSKLGWINCDRFIRSRNKVKYKLKVKDYKGTLVNMVFKSMYSVLPSQKINGIYDFKDVPNNEDVILIAIKKDEGKLYLDVLETKTQENPSLEFNFKEVSIEELKTQLKKLD